MPEHSSVGPCARRSPDWSQILQDAITQPGVISTAYTAFWHYSVGNQLLAMFECLLRGLQPGPIHTFKGWMKLGRFVRKGEKAITLCMPVKRRPKDSAESSDMPEAIEPNNVLRTFFILRPYWFVLSQTDGAPYQSVDLPEWEEGRALAALAIIRTDFTHTDGNTQGYAHGRSIAVSPVAYLPHRTLLHEVAHIVLGHCEEVNGLSDHDEQTPRDVREVEAEGVAYICCQALDLPGEEFSRGYLQHWLANKPIDNRCAQRIFKAADTILRAGRPPDVGHPIESLPE